MIIEPTQTSVTAPARAARSDGLTAAEGAVMDALVAAQAAMAALAVEHPSEMATFAHGIHECQGVLALRIARRAFPAGWPRRA